MRLLTFFTLLLSTQGPAIRMPREEVVLRLMELQNLSWSKAMQAGAQNINSLSSIGASLSVVGWYLLLFFVFVFVFFFQQWPCNVSNHWHAHLFFTIHSFDHSISCSPFPSDTNLCRNDQRAIEDSAHQHPCGQQRRQHLPAPIEQHLQRCVKCVPPL